MSTQHRPKPNGSRTQRPGRVPRMLDPVIYHAAAEFFARMRDAKNITDINIAGGIALENLRAHAELSARDLDASLLGDGVDRLLEPVESMQDLSCRLVMPDDGSLSVEEPGGGSV